MFLTPISFTSHRFRRTLSVLLRLTLTLHIIMLFVQIFLAAAASVSVSARPSLSETGLAAHVNALAFRQTNETGAIDINGDILSGLNVTDAQRAEMDQCYGLCMFDVISGDLISKCGEIKPEL